VECADFAAAGIEAAFVQDNHVRNPLKGALRGLHYRMPPVDRDRKFADSPLEQAGFELPVPLARCTILRSGEVGRLKTGEAQIRSVCTLHSTIADFVWS
jgi:hypothetical protein